MAVQVAERPEAESRRPHIALWIGLLLFLALGTGWAVLAGADAVAVRGTPIGDEAAPLIWIWVGYAVICSVLVPVLALLRPRAYLSATLLGAAIAIGIVLVVGVADSVPGPVATFPNGHDEPAWEPVVTHAGLGTLFVVGMVIAAFLITRRAEAPLLSLGILAVGLGASAATAFMFSMNEAIMMAQGAPEWTGIPEFRREVASGKSYVDLVLVAGYLTAAIVGLVRAVRQRTTIGIVFFTLSLLGIVVYGAATELLFIVLFIPLALIG